MPANISDFSGMQAYYSERSSTIDASITGDLESQLQSTVGTENWGDNTTTTQEKVEEVSTFSAFEDALETAAGIVMSDDDSYATFQNALSSIKGNSSNTFFTILSEVASVIANTVYYDDGVTETAFGADMENSWKTFFNWLRGGSQAVLNLDTPLGSKDASAVYGNLILGTPPLFTSTTDPKNRVTLNTFVKDFRFLSLTPGMPKYNGGYTEQMIYNGSSDTFKTQTRLPSEVLDYLRKNGLDTDFGNKDKRYYTFETAFDDYYAYLETMLNAIWIKLGLAKNENDKYSLFTFSKGESVSSDLQAQYKTALGFYLERVPNISESISNSEFQNNIEGDINAASDNFQNINYLTGMGSATGAMAAVKSINRGTAGMLQQWDTLKSRIIDPIMNGVTLSVKGILNLAKNIASYGANNDISAVIQQFTVTNGMKVKYPNLWSDSAYSKNMNFDFEFFSPYGDPLSIFHYVYVPFCALLCFALPRQADQNGYVSPFFVRADVPGHFTTDLALVSDMTWTKGGSSGNLFTKDGLPRSIHVSLTLTDLYPYLSMTKRVSFLSANPSYTVFLDSMAGLHAVYDGSADDDYLNQYFKDMLNRVTGNSDYANSERKAGLVNEYSSAVFKNARTSGYQNGSANPVSAGKGKFSTPWFMNLNR